MIINSKICAHCGKEKPISQFGDSQNMEDGKNKYCLTCAAEAARQHRRRKKIENLKVQLNRCIKCGIYNDIRIYTIDPNVGLEADNVVMLCAEHEAEAQERFQNDMGSLMLWLREKTCKRCGHEWTAITALPVVCPRCNAHRWYEEEQG